MKEILRFNVQEVRSNNPLSLIQSENFHFGLQSGLFSSQHMLTVDPNIFSLVCPSAIMVLPVPLSVPACRLIHAGRWQEPGKVCSTLLFRRWERHRECDCLAALRPTWGSSPLVWRHRHAGLYYLRHIQLLKCKYVVEKGLGFAEGVRVGEEARAYVREQCAWAAVGPLLARESRQVVGSIDVRSVVTQWVKLPPSRIPHKY